MEQKAKRVGKFNVVDVIAVVLILAVAAFAGMKLMNRGGEEGGQAAMTKVTYVVKAEGVPVELYESCQAHLPSPLMASGELVGGQIESVEKEPYYVLGPDGQWVEDPEHVTPVSYTHLVYLLVRRGYQGETELRHLTAVSAAKM